MAKSGKKDKSTKHLSGYIDNLKEDEEIETDADLYDSDRKSMLNHSAQYDRLLRIYVDKTELAYNMKKDHAPTCIKYSLSILRGVLVIMAVTVFLVIVNGVTVEDLVLLFHVLISFLAVYIIIPKIITKYFFNEKEEEYTATIINNIQEFDKKIRDDLQDADRKIK